MEVYTRRDKPPAVLRQSSRSHGPVVVNAVVVSMLFLPSKHLCHFHASFSAGFRTPHTGSQLKGGKKMQEG